MKEKPTARKLKTSDRYTGHIYDGTYWGSLTRTRCLLKLNQRENQKVTEFGSTEVYVKKICCGKKKKGSLSQLLVIMYQKRTTNMTDVTESGKFYKCEQTCQTNWTKFDIFTPK